MENVAIEEGCKLRARVFEVVSLVEFLGEERICNALNSHKIVQKYAWILHDKDTYLDEDEAKDQTHKAGLLKPAHYHVVLQLSTPTELRLIANWFGVPENFVEVPKGGADKFLDKVEYLTHESEKEQAKGKHLYSDEEIHANFDFRKALNERLENKVKYGRRSITDKEKMRYEVLVEGKTLRQCQQDNPLLYAEDLDKLRKLRGQYLMNANPPSCRVNFYVQGDGGIGKGLLCRALARSLYPNMEDDDEIFFIVGANGVGFEGYDGQPVIIWNDKRSYELVRMLGGVGNVFDVFDTFPTKSKQNVKYSSVNLVNAVNIVNSVQPYTEFLDGLAGEYVDKDGRHYEAEDKSQSYRRFPMMLVLHEEDYDMLINKGYVDDTRNFLEYYAYRHIRGNFARINQRFHDKSLIRQYEAKTILPVVERHNDIVKKLIYEVDDVEALQEEFQDYGSYNLDAIRVEQEAAEADQEVREKVESVKEKIKNEKDKENNYEIWKRYITLWQEESIHLRAIRLWRQSGDSHSGTPGADELAPYLSLVEEEVKKEKAEKGRIREEKIAAKAKEGMDEVDACFSFD